MICKATSLGYLRGEKEIDLLKSHPRNIKFEKDDEDED